MSKTDWKIASRMVWAGWAMIAILGATASIQSCSSNPATDSYNYKTAYHAGQVGWLALCPANGSGTYKFCHDPQVLSDVKTADNAAYAATSAYENTAKTLCPTTDSCSSGVNATALETAKAAADASVKAFTSLLATWGVK